MTRARFSIAFLIAATLVVALVSGTRFTLTADEPADAELRTWKDAAGTHSVEATFVEFKNDKVKLRKKDGSEVSVPAIKLSKEDQAYIRAELARRRNATKAASTTSSSGTAAKSSGGNSSGGDGEWNQWRGPRRDGISPETGLLKSWPEDGPPLAWQVTGLGGGFSSVAIAHGRIYTMGLIDGDSHLIALDEKDGKVLWKSLVREGDSPPNCTPTVGDDIVIGLGFKGDLVCVDAASGKETWRKNFERDFGGQMMSGWGYSESPLIDGDRVICTPGADGAMLAALDKRSGKALWTTTVKIAGGGSNGAAYSSVVISNGGGVKQYVQLVGRGVIGVSAQTGELLWGYERIANGTANIPTPIVNGDYIFCSTGYQTGAALLKLSSAGKGKVNAQEVYFLDAKTMQNHHGGMILLGDHIYCGHGHNEGFPLCIEMATGREAWRPGRGAGSGSAAVAYADGHLYFRYQNGVMALIEATPSEYKLKGKFTLASRRGESWPHPVIAHGKLYARDQDALLCYDVKE